MDKFLRSTLSESQIQAIQSQLEAAGVNGVPSFMKKLRDNVNNPMTVQDLLVEAETALTFRAHDLNVSMQDRPDLMFQFEGHTMHAECKHYQEKTSDSRDAEKLERYSTSGMFQEYGAPAAVQDQVLADLEEKAREYCLEEPFVLVLKTSSSHRVERPEVEGAVHVAKEIAFKDSSHPLALISAVLFMDHWNSLSKHRTVYFFPMISARNPLPKAVRVVLESINYYTPIEN